MTSSIKSVSRQYRKSLSSCRGKIAFPRTGAFHVRNESGNVLSPEWVRSRARILDAGDVVIMDGPAPLVSWEPKLAPVPTPSASDAPDDLPALPEVFNRRIREAKAEGGKRRIDYVRERNPKPGSRYWVKSVQPSGKMKWMEVEFSSLLQKSDVA